jgi:hypothetical protein
MSAPALEILVPVRAAITAVSYITSRLGTYQSGASVHTRRPTPPEAGYPMVTIGPVITRGDEDGINYWKPVVTVDLNTYGEQKAQYRTVDEVADALFQLFHRQRTAVTIENYNVVDLRCSGPSPAPVDDDSRVGRRVSLTARLFATYQ